MKVQLKKATRSLVLAGILLLVPFLAAACGGDSADTGGADSDRPTAELTDAREAGRDAEPTRRETPGRSGSQATEAVDDSVSTGQEETELVKYIYVSTGEDHSCAVREDGGVDCWGESQIRRTDIVVIPPDPPGGDFVSVSTGSGNTGWGTCGITSDDELICWQGPYSAENLMPPEGEFDAVSVGNPTCALHKDGDVECWYARWDGRGYRISDAFTVDGKFISISTANDGGPRACGVLQGGQVKCWDAIGDELNIAPDDERFASVSLGGEQICGVRQDGTVLCWERSYHDEDDLLPSPEGKFKSVSSGGDYVCGVQRDEAVVCWAYREGWPVNPSSPYPGKFAMVSADSTLGFNHTCGLLVDGQVVCWGTNTYGQATPPSGPFTAISAGGSAPDPHVCGLRQNGAISCWGSFYGGSRFRGGIEVADEFTAISSGSQGFCVLRKDRMMDCGAGSEALSIPGEYVQISNGWRHCGLEEGGRIRCWEWEAGEYIDQFSPPATEKFKAVSAGMWHVCAIRMNDSVHCWHNPEYEQPVSPTGEFIAVSTGDEYGCGIRTDGTAECWGKDDYGESTPPSGKFTEISAANNHTCGLREDGSIDCWGKNTDNNGRELGQATPPEGKFLSVKTAYDHSCGLREDGAVLCWGGLSSITPTGLP